MAALRCHRRRRLSSASAKAHVDDPVARARARGPTALGIVSLCDGVTTGHVPRRDSPTRQVGELCKRGIGLLADVSRRDRCCGATRLLHRQSRRRSCAATAVLLADDPRVADRRTRAHGERGQRCGERASRHRVNGRFANAVAASVPMMPAIPRPHKYKPQPTETNGLMLCRWSYSYATT
jgi:hypothetical protein